MAPHFGALGRSEGSCLEFLAVRPHFSSGTVSSYDPGCPALTSALEKRPWTVVSAVGGSWQLYEHACWWDSEHLFHRQLAGLDPGYSSTLKSPGIWKPLESPSEVGKQSTSEPHGTFWHPLLSNWSEQAVLCLLQYLHFDKTCIGRDWKHSV